MEKYITPDIEFVKLSINDVITASPSEVGVETPWYEENDGSWEIGI